MRKSKFPLTIKRGHTIVKIYLTPSKGRKAYTVVHYLGPQRQRRMFADLDEAVTEAETVAGKLSAGELDVLTLRSDDRLSYVRALETLKPTGVQLELAALQFAEAFKVLDGGSLLEAARFYAKQRPHRLPVKTVTEVVAELIQAKVTDRMSDVYVNDLRGRLGRFANAFKAPIGLLTTAEIEDFLRGLGLSGRSRNNYRRAIATLVHFAETRGYLAKGTLAIESVAVAKEDQGEIEIFTPEELARMLETAEPALIPFLTIGAFAGLRHAEIVRLDWSEVRSADGFIEVKASKAKTANRRLVPIPENLESWLALHRQPSGKVCPDVNMAQQLTWLAEAVIAKWQKETPPGHFVWKHNALRHSFISYRVAQVQNVAQVALEAGTSPQMIFSNYRELVRPADAKTWFSICPAAGDKVLVLPGVKLAEQKAESKRPKGEVTEQASGAAS